MIQTLVLIFLFLVGAAVGSFTSVVVYRLHKEKKGILNGRSECPKCEKKLKPLDLIPIASYLVLRGKCRYCDREISFMYPLLELVTGLLFAMLFIKFPFVNESLQFSENMLAMYALYAFYAFILVFTFFYDLQYMVVADEILLPGILIGLIASLAVPAAPNFWSALLGVGIGAAFFELQILASRGKWVGSGDVRVGAFMGAILGWKLLLFALLISYLLGSIVALVMVIKKRRFFDVKIPFAPILVAGTFFTIFFGEELLEWYLQGVWW